MRHAAELARTVAGQTSPNPPVGAVILDPDGHLIGQGVTQPAGSAHAEVMALAEAGEPGPRSDRGRHPGAVQPHRPHRALHRGADRGRHPPGRVRRRRSRPGRRWRRRPAAAGRAGGGRRRRDRAGEGRRPSDRGCTRWCRPRPFVTWKFAATLDGRAAAADGSSRWISNPISRADVHDLRSRVDAIVVGSGTALADNPQLTVRISPGRRNRNVGRAAAAAGPDGPPASGARHRAHLR